MITENVKVGILKKGRLIFLLSIILELICFSLSLTNTPPLLRVIIIFPSLFILPGAVLLVVLRGGRRRTRAREILTDNRIHKNKVRVKIIGRPKLLRARIGNMVKLAVEGFFISTVISVILTSLMLILGLPLVPFTYSLTMLIFALFLAMIALVRKIEFKPSKPDILLIALAFLSYVVLLLYFSRLPRLFTVDETGYIFSARTGILNGAVPPIGVRPHENVVTALFQGRVFWIYLLTSFIGSTGLPAHQAGLLGVGFLIMTALASSLIVKNKWLSTAVFAIVAVNPLLFSFSALTLNDLAISFYVVFAVLFFVRSFSKVDNNVSINIANLLYSLLGVIVLTLIKPNLLVFVAMWIILLYIMLRYKLYKLNRKYNILLMAVSLPVLIYELGMDIPYVISMWIFRNRELGSLFSKFLFASPAERFVRWFLAPWWNPAATTIFTRGFIDYLEYFYRILMPESSSLLISAVILALPILLLSQDRRKELDKTVLTSLVLLSLCLFYFEALSSKSLNDASRFSLWMIPLWIPLALTVLRDIMDSSSLRKLLPIFITALILLLVNIWLSMEKGGVYVGYVPRSRLWTANAIAVQLMSLEVIIGLLFLREDLLKVGLAIGRKLSVVKRIDLRNAVFCLMIILILLNGAYFSSQFTEKSLLYEDHGFAKINDALNSFEGDGSLVFANNYIYMRPQISDKLFKQGLLLPPPDTNEEFLKLLKTAPNNTLFLISNDSATTWYEYSNKYIKGYAYSDIITPESLGISKFPKFNLTEPILAMTFDDANEMAVTDHSGLENNGVNCGAEPVEGYYGKALRFDGKEYISIPSNDVLNVQNEITISFLAIIEKTEPRKGYMILSKGYAPENGSYNVFVYEGKIFFSLGEVGSVSVRAEPYVGAYHHFIFTYDGEKMEIYIDGSPLASNPARGLIRVSSYDLEIGRDSPRGVGYHFVGLIDELQISNRPLNKTELVKSYYTYYAPRILKLSLPKGQAELFSVVNDKSVDQSIAVKDSGVNVNENRTVTLKMQIESPRSKNITILIATDRFTKVYDISLDTGVNNVKFQFDYIIDPSQDQPGGFYRVHWVYLAQARLIVIEDDTISYNRFVTTQDLKLMNVLLLTLLLGILAVLSYCSYKEKTKV